MSNITNSDIPSGTNPLLYTFEQDNVAIQPYWVAIIELIILQLFQRIWNWVTADHTWFTTIEIAMLNHSIEDVESDSDFERRHEEYRDATMRWHDENLEKIARHYKGGIEAVGRQAREQQEGFNVARQYLTAAQNAQRQGNHALAAVYLDKYQQARSKNLDRTPQPIKRVQLDPVPKMKEKESLRKALRLNFLDCLTSLPIIAHIIWYCIIQSNCPSASTYSNNWTCYNVFGYRLFNYVFGPYFLLLFNIYYKALSYSERGQRIPNGKIFETAAELSTFFRFVHYLTVTVLIITLIFATAVILPYFFTNMLPMLVVYVWMTIIYVFAILCARSILMLLTEGPCLPQGCCLKKSLKNQIPFGKISLTLVLGGLVFPTIPIWCATLFNYSQYFYFGASYLTTIYNEYQSRNTTKYFQLFQNSTQQILHSVLNL